MTPEEVVTVVAEMMIDHAGRVWIENGVAHIELPSNQVDRHAQISTPGDRWFSIDVDNDFSLDRFVEDTTFDEAKEILQEFLRVGAAYIRYGGRVRDPKSFLPVLTVSVDGVEYELRRSVAAAVRAAWGRLRRSSR